MYQNLKMHLNLLLNGASLAFKVLLNATWIVKYLRIEVECCKEVGHLKKVESVILKRLSGSSYKVPQTVILSWSC